MQFTRVNLQDGTLEITTSQGPDVRQRSRRQRQAWHRKRLLRFKAETFKRKITITKELCPCGRNHFAVRARNSKGDFLYCPVLFWLNMCQLYRLQGGDRAMLEWATESPIANFVRKIDEKRDATWCPSLDWRQDEVHG